MNVEDIRNFCISLPAVTEDLKWGDNLVFSVKQKMFCIVSLDNVPLTLSFKADDENFASLPQEPNFAPAPYLAKAKWILLKDISLVGDDVLKSYLEKAYTLIKAKLSKKMQQEIDLMG